MPSTSTAKPPHVLIVGAGIGGLTLAQALRGANVSFDIYERDESVDARTQGWAIALHSFLDDLLESVPNDMPPLDEVNHLLPLPHPPQLCFYAGPMKFHVEGGGDTHIIRANRLKLRRWLATHIDVHWNKRVTSVAQTDDAVTVTFSDGTFATGDVLVGADGVNSIVRTSLPTTPTHATRLPISTIIGEPTLHGAPFTTQLTLGHSASVIMGPTFHLFIGLNHVHPSGTSGKYYWVLNYSDPAAAHGTSSIETMSQQELLDFAREMCEGFEDKFTRILWLTKAEDVLSPPLVLRDIVIEGIPRGRVTVVGDAAHAMAPFRGEGGSNAMKDGLNLARILARADARGIPEALKAYEGEMLPRGREAVEKSRAALTMGEGAGGGGGDGGEARAWGAVMTMGTH